VKLRRDKRREPLLDVDTRQGDRTQVRNRGGRTQDRTRGGRNQDRTRGGRNQDRTRGGRNQDRTRRNRSHPIPMARTDQAKESELELERGNRRNLELGTLPE
jgi:ATP-dependent RNA helicase DHX8/PRP22